MDAFKSSINLYFYDATISSYESELMLTAVLSCLFNSLNQMLRRNGGKIALLETMKEFFLAADETVDGGVTLESDHLSNHLYSSNMDAFNFLLLCDSFRETASIRVLAGSR